MQSTPPSPLVPMVNVNPFYGSAHVLFDINIEIYRGEAVALTGRKGVGKSTTTKTIMGLLNGTTGNIYFQRQDITHIRPDQIARMGVGFVPEDRRIFTDLTVLENLEVGRQPPRADTVTWTVEKLFALFPHLARMQHRRGGQMSGGEQQMLTIARTLMGNPRLLLLDEPSEGLAPVIIEQIGQMILSLKHAGVSILLSEQNLQFAALICDRSYALESGYNVTPTDTHGLISKSPPPPIY